MIKDKSRMASPIATGGKGFRFECCVQASFVVLMLSGSVSPCLPQWPIEKICLQNRYRDFSIDDIIVCVRSPNLRKSNWKHLKQP